MNVSVNLTGLEKLKARIDLIRANTANLQPALLRAGVVVLKAAADRIDSGGPGWRPNVTGTPMLHQTGRLLSSLTVGGPDNIDDADGDTVVVGTNVRYAAWLQDGTGIFGDRGEPITPTDKKALAFNLGGRRIVVRSVKGAPPRPFLYVDEKVASTVRDLFAAYILGEGDAS